MSQMGKYFIASGGGGAIDTLTGNVGGAVPPDGGANIDVVGTNPIVVTGSIPSNSLTVTVEDATTSQKGVMELSTDAESIAGTATSVAVVPSSLKAKLGSQTANCVPYGAGTTSALSWASAATDGQLLIGATGAAPVFASLTSSGATITITPGANSINLEAVGGGGGITTVPTDSGSATPAAGSLTIAGGTNVNTSGAGSTVTVNLDSSPSVSGSLSAGTTMTAGTGLTVSAGGIDSTGTTTLQSLSAGVMQTNGSGVVSSSNGSNGQLLIGGGSAPAWANLTSTGGSVVITNGANSINLEASGGGGGAVQFDTDSGSATVAAGVIDILGGSNIGTTGSGSAVTVNLDNSPSVSGSLTAATDITSTSGSLNLPDTNAAGTEGDISFGGTRLMHNYGVRNLFLGISVGNTTLGVNTLANVGIGENVLSAIATQAQFNIGIGNDALQSLTEGDGNIAIGNDALTSLTTGLRNIAIGYYSGNAYTSSEQYNICIYNTGTISDANTIRIGTHGSGVGQQDTTYIAGDITGAASITSTTTVVAGTGITATTGNIVASTGNITSTLGSLDAATTVTAGTGITATTGDITASTGDLVSTLGAVDAATTVTAGTSMSSGTTCTVGTNLTVSGLGRGVAQTDASGVVSSSEGTDGQLLISSSSGAPAWANLTSTGGSVTITNGANSINLEASGTGYLAQLDGDSGSATPTGGAITIAGGANLTSSAAGSTVTMDLDSAITNISTFTLANTGSIRTTTSAGNTAVIQAYDTDGTFYTTFATLTANNTPTMDLDDAVTKGGQYIYRAAGTDVPVTDGGTGASTLTDHGVLVGSGTGAVTALGVGATNQVLLGSTGADPTWGAVDLTTDVTGTLPVTNGGVGAATLTDHGVLVGSGTSAVTPLTVGTNGQVLLGSTGADPVFATLTSSGGTITFTPGAGSLNLEAGGGGISWNEVTGTSQTAAVDNGYICNNAGLVTVTLPDTAALGSVVRICGKGAGGWKVAQNAGETIYWDESTATTTGVGGSLASSDDYDSIELLCITADTDWCVISSKGNITVA